MEAKMYPKDLKYTKTHEWVKVDGDEATVGVTDFAQHQLSDIVYVELPEVGANFDKGEQIAVVESSKMAADCYSPISGEIIAINENLEDQPELINNDPHKGGWMYKINMSAPADLDDTVDAEAYEKSLENES
jgi:glycine cleavage system H protein